MSGIGILSNARSRRNQTDMAAIERLLAEYPQVKHRPFDRIEDMPAAIASMAAEGVDHLVVNGGDGTTQAVLGELLDRSPFANLPRLTLIGGGMTNVVAHDVGLPNAPVEALQRILARAIAGDKGEAIQRTAIAVRCSGHDQTIYGFLAGAVGFYQGTRLTRRDMHRVGFRQSLATKAGIVWSVVRLLLHGEGETSGIHGEPVAIGLNGAAPREAPYLLLLATTLDRLLPGVNPFWGDDEGVIKLTTIASPARHFTFAAIPVVRGRPRPWMLTSSYASTRADRISLKLKSPILVDGEVFDPGPSGLVELNAGPIITFHRY